MRCMGCNGQYVEKLVYTESYIPLRRYSVCWNNRYGWRKEALDGVLTQLKKYFGVIRLHIGTSEHAL